MLCFRPGLIPASSEQIASRFLKMLEARYFPTAWSPASPNTSYENYKVAVYKKQKNIPNAAKNVVVMEADPCGMQKMQTKCMDLSQRNLLAPEEITTD